MKLAPSVYPVFRKENKGIGMMIAMNITKITSSCLKREQRTHQDICPLPWRGVGKPQSQYLFIQICQDEVGKVKHLTVYSKF